MDIKMTHLVSFLLLFAVTLPAVKAEESPELRQTVLETDEDIQNPANHLGSMVVNCHQTCDAQDVAKQYVNTLGNLLGNKTKEIDSRLGVIERVVKEQGDELKRKMENLLSVVGNLSKNIPAPRQSCPSNFQQVGDICFKIIESSLSWDDAKGNCEELEPRGRLLVVRDQQAYQQVARRIASLKTGTEIWIGLRLESGTWRWMDGSTLQYDEWESSQPNEDGDCTRLNCDSDDMSCDNRLWDGPCSEADFYACEIY